MRRSLTRATAACAAYALVLVLGAVAPATADEEAPAATDGTAVPGEHGASGERSGEPRRTASDAGGSGDPTGSGGPSAADGSPVPVRSNGERTEAESSSWTYVDRASPDRPHGGTETASVGTGRLEWDRVYTRRVLFRFPVALGPGAVVDSAVLRTEVVWSYDCGSDSFVRLHRVDPFDDRTTWNDQPRARALLDTRRVRGGRPACPVTGGVEFDVTEAYQWAVDNGEPHLHLRLGERDESGTTAWRRFDVEDDPPVLVVDHSTRRTPGTASSPNDLRGDSREDTAVHGEDAADLAPTGSGGGFILSGVTAPGAGGDDARVPGPVSAGWLPSGGGRIRSRRGERTDCPTAPDGHRRRDGDTPPRVRGPPSTTRSETVSRFTDRGEPADGRRHPPFPVRHPAGRRQRTGGGPRASGRPLFRSTAWWRNSEAAAEPYHRRTGHRARWPPAVTAGLRAGGRGVPSPTPDASAVEPGRGLCRRGSRRPGTSCAHGHRTGGRRAVVGVRARTPVRFPRGGPRRSIGSMPRTSAPMLCSRTPTHSLVLLWAATVLTPRGRDPVGPACSCRAPAARVCRASGSGSGVSWCRRCRRTASTEPGTWRRPPPV